jgi:hypothetical protein
LAEAILDPQNSKWPSGEHLKWNVLLLFDLFIG